MMTLKEYHKKRNFKKTAEPEGDQRRVATREVKGATAQFVIQKHAATRLHYDFRLEHAGVLKSWAVPHGPSLDPSVKSLAVQVEDHPLDYANFEGTIPKGQYGGGTVMVWDRGTWFSEESDVTAAFERGKISFHLDGEKLHGAWTLVRLRGRENENWLLIKKKDGYANHDTDILAAQPRSVLTNRDLSEIADGAPPKKKGQSRASRKTRSATATKAKPVKAKTASRKTLDRLQTAPRTEMPEQLSPQLATLSQSIPNGDEWLHEIKLDGYRILARLDHGQVTLQTRGGLDWTDRFPSIARWLAGLPVEQAWLDGEIVAEDQRGASSFQQLQNALAEKHDRSLVYYVFDLPWAEGHDLSKLPLIERKQVLQGLLQSPRKNVGRHVDNTPASVVRYHDHITGAGDSVLDGACDLKLEGIISKRRDSTYQSRRSDSWLKVKCGHEQEFVIAGYTRPTGKRTGFGALLLGYYRENDLMYCGRVGTGFTEASLRELKPRLAKLETKDCSFAKRPTGAQLRGVTWLKPQLVAQISYATRTNDGILRHAVFHGLREDKPARQVSMETSQSLKRAKSVSKQANELAITHPERIVYTEPELTKADLVHYLTEVGPWLLPGIVGRPLSLLRCPQGVGKPCFYQKEFDEKLPKGLDRITVREKNSETRYVVVKDLDGLMALAQLNVIEFHPWPALAKDLEKPDRLVFDLDPGEGATWKAVVEGARLVRKLLQDVSIKSYVRTSGGKGLHVVAPIQPGAMSWDELKAFAKLLSQTMARQHPKLYVATITKSARRGKIFVDYLRNQRGATAVASYSPRARAGAGVAMPIRWQDLDDVTNTDFTVVNALQHIKRRRSDPWQDRRL